MRKIIPVMVSVAALFGALAGCQKYVQPERSDLTGMNAFSEGCYQLRVSVDLIHDNFAMQYNSLVSSEPGRAVWEGSAMAFFMNTYFAQDCTTYYAAGNSRKAWRSGWVESDAEDPLAQIARWQEELNSGSGVYTRRPTDPAAIHEDLSDIGQSVYTIVLKHSDVDWNAVCDVDLDLLFGGNELLTELQAPEVTLVYGAEDWRLHGITITGEEEDRWVSACIRILPADKIPEFDLEEMPSKIGYPAEEWDIYRVNEADPQ